MLYDYNTSILFIACHGTNHGEVVMLTRRRFLTLAVPSLVVLSGGITYWGIKKSNCPLGSESYCLGPCAAYTSSSSSGLCDHLSAEAGLADAQAIDNETQATIAPTATAEAATSPTSAASTTAEATAAATATASSTAVPKATTARTACPYGLVNDPAPGRCGRFRDSDGSGYCDYSETSA